MNNSLDDDLKNRNIIINSIDPTPLSSKEQMKSPPESQPKPGINLVKNTYSNFIKNIKNLATKKTMADPPQSGEVEVSSSQNLSLEAPKTWKDKVALTIINKLEVQRNITVFLSLLGLGSLLLCFSIFLLPFIITSPSKFSMCFAFGCSLVLISFLFYHGTKNYIMKLFDKKRFIITILFVCSIILGLIFSLGKHYFISLLCSLFQLISLILFVLTFIPGGKYGINCIKRKMGSPFIRVFSNLV